MFSGKWIRNEHVIAVQDQALRTNAIKTKIDKQPVIDCVGQRKR